MRVTFCPGNKRRLHTQFLISNDGVLTTLCTMVKTDKNSSGKDKAKATAKSATPENNTSKMKTVAYGFERKPAQAKPGPDLSAMETNLGVTTFSRVSRRRGSNSVTTAALKTGEMIIDVHNPADSPDESPYIHRLKEAFEDDNMGFRSTTGYTHCLNKRDPNDRDAYISNSGVGKASGIPFTRYWPVFVQSFLYVENNTLENRQKAGKYAADTFETHSMERTDLFRFRLKCDYIGDSTPANNDLRASDLFTTIDTIDLIKHVYSDRTDEEIAENESLLVDYFGQDGVPHARELLNPKKYPPSKRPSSPSLSSFSDTFHPSPLKGL